MKIVYVRSVYKIGGRPEQAFAELYVKRYMEDQKVDKSSVACEAILALHQIEKEKREDEDLGENE